MNIRGNTSRADDEIKAIYSNAGHRSTSILNSAKRTGMKILSNLPSGKYFEMKDEQMLPGPSQDAV